jgi:hypothetical protein
MFCCRAAHNRQADTVPLVPPSHLLLPGPSSMSRSSLVRLRTRCASLATRPAATLVELAHLLDLVEESESESVEHALTDPVT